MLCIAWKEIQNCALQLIWKITEKSWTFLFGNIFKRRYRGYYSFRKALEMVTNSFKNKVQAAGIKNWALCLLHLFISIFNADDAVSRIFCQAIAILKQFGQNESRAIPAESSCKKISWKRLNKLWTGTRRNKFCSPQKKTKREDSQTDSKFTFF